MMICGYTHLTNKVLIKKYLKMRNIKKFRNHIVLLGALFLLLSCDDDEVNGVVFSENASEVSISPSSISTLDIMQMFTLKTKSIGDQPVQSIRVDLQGDKIDALSEIGSTMLQNNEGTINLSSNVLKLEKAGDESTLHLTTSGTITPSTTITSVSMFNPVEASVSSNIIEAQTSINDTLNYKITTRSAQVDRVIIEQKSFFDGTYAEIMPPTDGWSTKEGIYSYQGQNLTLNDTVYYRVTAFSGSLMAQSSEIKVFVDTQRINGISGEASLNNTTSNYSLLESSLIADPEITFDDANFGFTGADMVDINFIKIETPDAMDIFKSKDLLKANAAYSSGTPTNTVSNVEFGDVYVYKIARTKSDDSVVNSTGLLSITEVSVINDTNSLSFSYAEEVDP